MVKIADWLHVVVRDDPFLPGDLLLYELRYFFVVFM
jgi:hypothetical protein